MKKTIRMKTLAPVIFLGAVCLASACTDELPSTSGASSSSSSSGVGGEGGAGAGGSGGSGGGEPACYANPKTHVEIINACTDAEMVDKVVNLPLLLPDGSLPNPP
jgi:hypothetical protein